MVAAAAVACRRARRCAHLLGADSQRLCEHLLRRGGAGGLAQLEGLADQRGRHERLGQPRQGAAVEHADGALRAPVRLLDLHDARARGSLWRWRRAASAQHGQAHARASGGAARRADAGADADLRGDEPLQQSRRAARAVGGCGRLGARARAAIWAHARRAAVRGVRRACLQREDAAGLPDRARAGADTFDRRARHDPAAARTAAGRGRGDVLRELRSGTER